MDDCLDPQLIEEARRVVTANLAAGRRIVVAESCTGGLVSAALTSIAGSSSVFEAGYVTYSNDAKMDMLQVDSNILETFGAVSIATAWAMAQGALMRSGADVAVAITGIAGRDRRHAAVRRHWTRRHPASGCARRPGAVDAIKSFCTADKGIGHFVKSSFEDLSSKCFK